MQITESSKLKNKSRVTPLLHLELRRISHQIGIHQCEIPELFFDYKEFNEKHLAKDYYSYKRKNKNQNYVEG